MNSKDYFEGYKDAVEMMTDKLHDAIREMDKYGNRKSFKGMSKREVVWECQDIIRKVVNEWKNT